MADFQRMIVVTLISLLIGCTRMETADNSPTELQGPLAQESWDVSLEISEKGVIRLTLEAAHMLRYEEPDSVFAMFERSDTLTDRVTASFFDSLGIGTGTLIAERIRFDEVDHSMIASGDVVLTSSDGSKLETEELLWDEGEGTISAPGFVSLMTDDRNLRGYELEANEDLSNWSIKRLSGSVRIRE